MEENIIFVYNANSDLFSTVTDFAHKILSPNTYKCHLCALTYGSFSMKKDWKSFLESLPVEIVFLHKDEFEKQYKIQPDLPAIFISRDESIEQIVTKQEIEDCQSPEDLKTVLNEKLKGHVQHYHSNIQ
jgi:hypothetical protein